jgi:hypothetical protein
LKEAILELYLSVKIRSDDEIDNYTEEQFREEKRQMRNVDGFTLVDYIKSSIEILMNMKIEDDNGGGGGHAAAGRNGGGAGGHFGDEDIDIIEDEEARAERKRRKRERREAKKKKKEQIAAANGGEEAKKEAGRKAIPKIDNATPTSSIIDLQ